MTSTRPADFYTGIVAQAYGPLRSTVPDPAPYAAFVRHYGTPALELGCGDGDPLLDLVADGLDVEGLDSSADMLDRCRTTAAERGLRVELHHQTMEGMDLGRRYRAIYVAGPTFNLIPNDAGGLDALRRIAVHLDPEGAALVPVFTAPPIGQVAIGRTREHTTDDGTVLRVGAIDETLDDEARTVTTVLRYEIEEHGSTTVDDRPWLLHWYPADRFAELAERAGLTIAARVRPDGTPAEDGDPLMVHVLALTVDRGLTIGSPRTAG